MNTPLAQLYINRDYVLSQEEELFKDNIPYAQLVKHKRSDILPFNHIGGVIPYDKDENFFTTAQRFNEEITKKNKDKDTQEKFYREIQNRNRNEIYYLRRQNKLDHVKKIDLALNFKMQPTNYHDDYEFTEEKNYATNHPDDVNHRKKNEIKTYEESKMKALCIIRSNRDKNPNMKF